MWALWRTRILKTTRDGNGINTGHYMYIRQSEGITTATRVASEYMSSLAVVNKCRFSTRCVRLTSDIL